MSRNTHVLGPPVNGQLTPPRYAEYVMDVSTVGREAGVEEMIALLKKAALLGMFALLGAGMWAGPASAAENGRLYYKVNGGDIYSVDATAGNAQPNWVLD